MKCIVNAKDKINAQKNYNYIKQNVWVDTQTEFKNI